jgi:hypothetical protein
MVVEKVVLCPTWQAWLRETQNLLLALQCGNDGIFCMVAWIVFERQLPDTVGRVVLLLVLVF